MLEPSPGHLGPVRAGPARALCISLIDVLEEHDDVQNVYSNLDIPDEVATQLDAE